MLGFLSHQCRRSSCKSDNPAHPDSDHPAIALPKSAAPQLRPTPQSRRLTWGGVEKGEGRGVFEVVPLVDDFAPGVDPEKLKEMLNDMDVAAYLEAEGGGRARMWL